MHLLRYWPSFGLWATLYDMLLIYFLIFILFVGAYFAITIDKDSPFMLSRELRKKLVHKRKNGG